jgi:hypothetical protein
MQELLLLTLMSVLSPVSTQCTDQGEGEEVVEAEDESSEGEEETGDEGSDSQGENDQGSNSQAAPDGASASEKKEDKKKDGIVVSNDFDFSGDEFNNNKEETGTGSIFGPSTFEATEGVKVEAAAVPAA